MEPFAARPEPLRSWRFDGELRHYQADVLEQVPVVAGEPLHLVAPPGSGKTLLGLLLAVRHGRRAVVLAPTTTIRAQWARTAEALGGSEGGVSEDPLAPGDVTALTYQALSVLQAASPLADLAAEEWRRELVDGGRSAEDAAAWLVDLETAHPSAHRSGIARRSRGLRRQLARQDPELLETALHPNARALVDRLVAHGVETVVLDECHHLLDHWALVVAYLSARIRAAGGRPLLIGLTATLPSTEDASEFDNYTSLLGEVDYEVPTPAVVREGNLAPYPDAVWFTTPDDDELEFLRIHEAQLADLIEEVFSDDEGTGFLEATLQPGAEDDREESVETRIAAAFAADFVIAEAASRMLARILPAHPLVELLPADALDGPDTEQSVRLLARFALDRLLPVRERAPEWDRVKRTLVDFGYTLTDRGIRRGRDPIDTVLASSTSKDRAAAEILAGELSRGEGIEIAAVVVTDFAVHGNRRGARGVRAGALRCFDVLVADARLEALRPVLVTAQHLRIAGRDADELLPELERELGVVDLRTRAVDGSPEAVEVEVGGVGSAAVVAAVSSLVTRGVVRLIVGTRGLLGEGWDCPAVNTLIDLTAVATSAATQQLRGRTLRLDPAWPRKVAHNWTITTLVPPEIDIDAQPDLARMRRKHGRIWGLQRDDGSRIVRGIGIALTSGQLDLLERLVRKSREFTVDDLDREIVLALPSRAQSYDEWRVGEPYTDREGVRMSLPTRSVRPFRTGPALEYALAALLAVVGLAIAGAVLGGLAALTYSAVAGVVIAAVALVVLGVTSLPLVRAFAGTVRRLVAPPHTYRGVVLAVASALHAAGRIARYRADDVGVSVVSDGGALAQVEAGLTTGSTEDQRLVADSLAELFGPVRSPRFLLQIDRGDPPRSSQFLLTLAMRLTARVSRQERFLPVPSAIARRRDVAEAFAAAWWHEVGPCRLIELDTPERLATLVEARRRAPGDETPTRRETWS